MGSVVIERFEGAGITEEMVATAAQLFSEHYGIWGPWAEKKRVSKPGDRIKMSTRKLKAAILPSETHMPYTKIYASAHLDGQLIGNAFAAAWNRPDRPMLWITQLCVSSGHRNQGIAKQLLEALQGQERYVAVGILSSHPFAIAAMLRVFGNGIEKVDLGFIIKHAKYMMEMCPVDYVRKAELPGSLAGDETYFNKDPITFSANTQFWVDHTEPAEALEVLRRAGVHWPFGELSEGYEFLALVRPE